MKLKSLTRLALLTAGALVVFVIENQLPPLTPIPGIKPGLANIFTLFALYSLGAGQALVLLLLRVLLGCTVTGQLSAIIYSLAGGLLAFAVMLLFKRCIPEKQLWVVSVFAALAHSLGQMAVALLVTKTWALVYYLPLMLAASIPAGALTGLCAGLILKRLRKTNLLS